MDLCDELPFQPSPPPIYPPERVDGRSNPASPLIKCLHRPAQARIIPCTAGVSRGGSVGGF